MRYRHLLGLAIVIALVSAPGRAQTTPPAGQVRVNVTPATVEMGTFYGGATVQVEGMVALGDKVIIVVRGSGAKEVFNKVGRVGPIWVNTGKVTISGAPSVLMIFSSDAVGACLNRAALDSHYLDSDALIGEMHIESKVPDSGIANDFLKLKAKRGTYRLRGGDVRLGARTPEGLPYSLQFHFPRTVPPGAYRVTVLGCKNGEVVEQSEMDLKVVEIGFPAYIFELAMKRPAFYGVICVIVAMLAGFGIDFIAARLFKRRVTAH